MTDPAHEHGDPLDDPTADTGEVAERIAAAVGAVPGVVALHGGRYGDVSTFLPGRKLVGVRIGRVGEPVEVAVVLGLSRPIPVVVADVRRTVAALCGDRPVDVMVADVVEAPPGATIGPDPTRRRVQ